MEQNASNPQGVSASTASGDHQGKSSAVAASLPERADDDEAADVDIQRTELSSAHHDIQVAHAAGPGLTLKHPPRVPLVLRVGVVGHRPDSKKRPLPDVAALREISRQLLVKIQDTFAGIPRGDADLFSALPPRPDGRPPGLRLISSLAEGADQWVASEAVKLGFELQSVLPFERTEYEKDFTEPGVLAEHRRLRELSSAVFALDGCRDRPGDSYLAAGRVMLNQSDLLIALWDRKEEQGTGGTAQIVREALQRGVPTLWVNWAVPTEWTLSLPAWRLLKRPIDVKGDFTQLKDTLRELLQSPPPKQADDQLSATDLRETYFADRRRSWTLLGGWWNFFRDLVRARPHRLKVKVPDFIETTKADWQKDWNGDAPDKREHKLQQPIVDWVESSYLSPFAWANQLSVYYANNYRSSFIWIYLLGAVAVLLALIGKTADAAHLVEIVFIIGEVIVIGAIIGLTWYGRRRRWHERWIDYRIVAEQLRLARFNCLLGGVWQQVNVPSHLVTSGNNPAATWMHWYARAVERAAGLPNVTVDGRYLAACQELLLKSLITGQERYHRDNDQRLTRVDHRLHRFGAFLFLATLAVCLIHLFVALRPEQFGPTALAWERWLIFAAAFMPAAGAAMAGVRSQGEFQRLVQRSRAMQDELKHLREAIADVPPRANELNSQLLQQASEQASLLMYNEVLDWRIVFQNRPLDWPA